MKNKLNILNKIFSMNRRLKRQAAKLGLTYADRDLVSIKAYSESFSQVENDGKKYTYPETLSVKIESWSNHWFDVRLKDSTWVREGRYLTRPGIRTGEVYRAIIRELKEHAEYIKKVD